jgi:hypothetical protein
MQAGGKQVTQIVILVVLLAGLGFSAFRMVRLFNPPPAAKAPAAAAASSAQPSGGPVPAPPKDAAAKGAPPAGGAKAPATAGSSTFPILPNGAVNEDLFRVFALQPPKNPFIQKEEWYKDDLAKIPGYPELRDKGYFETMEPEFPDISKTFGAEKKWDSITLTREHASQLSLAGESKDGQIRTSLELKEAVPEDFKLTWTPDSGIPLSALKDPNYVRANADKLTSGPGAAPASGGGLAVPATGEVPEGLGIPGEAPDATSAGLTTGAVKGDALACLGVNLKGEKATALMHYNGVPYLVSAGSVLPTHYQVVEIKEDGVILLELRDGSSKWVPLQFVAAETKKK